MVSKSLVYRLLQPLFLFTGGGCYILGAGITHYLGYPLYANNFGLGLGLVIFLQISSNLLSEYFSSNIACDPVSGDDDQLKTNASSLKPDRVTHLPRRLLMLASFTSFTAASLFSVIILVNVKSDPILVLMIILGFLGAAFYFTPPINISSGGFGEVIHTFLVVFLVPVFAYILQTGELHRLLGMTLFPISLIYLAVLISLELPNYAHQIRVGENGLVQRMGWQNAMTIHNILIVSAFLGIAVAGIFRMPIAIVLAMMLALPLGALEIWQIWRIAQGNRPNWKALRANGIALFGTVLYLAAFTYWTR